MMEQLAQILLLLTVALTVVVTFQRLHIPTSLGYLFVGVILGPFTVGPTLAVSDFETIAEFGVVFLLFTIGLSFSLPQIHALRHQVLGLGTGQVVLTTLLVSVGLWLTGLPGPVAFVFGAVFAQSSTTIIASLLKEQGESNTQHGRLGLAMSVFQDVTAVPFLIIIPVLGASISADLLATTLAWAMAKAVFAFALIYFAGRWLLRPLFHFVSEKSSLEMFTLAVLLVALMAAWTTNSLGLSLAFGGFLAGMMLGETEFRHQVESTVRPFRDVLLGMFFVGIGMRFDPTALPPIWHWALLGTGLILLSKLLIVTLLARLHGTDIQNAFRSGLLMSVGGEFGLALIAIALDATVLDERLGQIAITSVLLAMVLGAVLIRFNAAIGGALFKPSSSTSSTAMEIPEAAQQLVVIGGYGRVGHTIAVMLKASGVPCIAFDTDPKRVEQGRTDGYQVNYGDITDPELLSTIHVERASLIVFTGNEPDTALRAAQYLRKNCPHLPVIARAQDLETSAQLLGAGAIHAYPESIEASLRLGAVALETLQIPSESIDQLLQGVRAWDYKPVQEKEARD